MTKLTGGSRVTRETESLTLQRGLRPIIVTLTSSRGIELRAKGTRKSYLLPYGIALLKAQMLEAEQVRIDRKVRKKQPRRGSSL